MVTCNICKVKFKKVTNTHLRDKHGLELAEYLRLFPNAKMTSRETVEAISKFSKGKSYIERYGEEKAIKLIETRKLTAYKQFENVEQRVLRRSKIWKGYKDISGDMWRVIQNGAKSRNLEFSVKIEEIWELFEKQRGICALSGFDIVLDVSLGSLNKNGYQKNTASLDRIDSTKGYITGNVQWVHKDINKLKSNWTEEYFLEMCSSVALYKTKN